MPRFLIAAVVLVTAASTAAAAQQSDSLLPGVRVRVTASAVGLPGRYAGTLVAITPESVTVGGGNPRLVAFPVRAVDRFELSRGMSHGLSAKKGLKRGLVIGGIAGLLLGAQVMTAPVCGESSTSVCRDEGVSGSTLMVSNIVLFGAMGGIYGATIGAFLKSERWKDVPLGNGPLRR